MKTRVIVSALLEKEGKLLLQTRNKPQVSPAYTGMLEIPAGGVDLFENVYDSLRREVKEETNLDVIKFKEKWGEVKYENVKGEKSSVFSPLFCQQMLETKAGLHWIGLVFLCEVAGKVKLEEKEAINPQWVTKDELGVMLKAQPEKFFPLQYGVLCEYVG